MKFYNNAYRYDLKCVEEQPDPDIAAEVKLDGTRPIRRGWTQMKDTGTDPDLVKPVFNDTGRIASSAASNDIIGLFFGGCSAESEGSDFFIQTNDSIADDEHFETPTLERPE